MTLRRAQPADAAAVTAIYAHYVATSAATFDEVPPRSESVTARIAELAAADLPFLVSETRGAIEGYGHLSPYRARPAYRHTVESSVYLAPEARGRGLGRALLERLLAEAARAGTREVVAVIAVTDDRASIALHHACGFREAGRLTGVGRKHGRWLDTLLMQRSLRA